MKAEIQPLLSKDQCHRVVLIARAKEIGAKTIVTASTGNAGAALTEIAAASGWHAIIFAPKSAPPAKIAQLLVFGRGHSCGRQL